MLRHRLRNRFQLLRLAELARHFFQALIDACNIQVAFFQFPLHFAKLADRVRHGDVSFLKGVHNVLNFFGKLRLLEGRGLFQQHLGLLEKRLLGIAEGERGRSLEVDPVMVPRQRNKIQSHEQKREACRYIGRFRNESRIEVIYFDLSRTAGCTAQLRPSRKTHSPFGLSSSASPSRYCRSRV